MKVKDLKLKKVDFPITINTVFFGVGLLGVWMTTHNLQAIFWTFIASIHLSISVNGKELIK